MQQLVIIGPHRPFHVASDVAGTCIWKCIKVVTVHRHLVLHRFHQAKDVVQTVFQFLFRKLCPWIAHQVVIVIIAGQLLMLRVKLAGKLFQAHVGLKIAASEFKVIPHLTVQNLPAIHAEDFLRLEQIDSLQELELIG